MRVLVTGGAGFIGSNLVRQLLRDDYEVAVIDDLTTGSISNIESLRIDFLEASILDRDALVRAVKGCEAVVHLAARPSVPRSIAHPEPTHEVNVTGTLNVLEAARSLADPFVILASSSSVYGSNPVMPKVETCTPMPMSPYAASKLAAEQYGLAWAHSYGIETLALRFFNVYGPLQSHKHDYAAVIPSFVDSILAKKPVRIFGDGLQTRDFTYVGTVCSVVSSALRRRVSSMSPVNLAYGTQTTLLQLLDLLEAVIGESAERIFAPARPGDVRDSCADNTLLRGLFPEIAPIELEIGLAETLNWFRANFAY